MSNEDERTPEELEAHVDDPTGPVRAAQDWALTAIRDGDLLSAWPATDPNLRLVLVQAWLWANREHEDVRDFDLEATAAALSEPDPSEHELWAAFEATQVDELREWVKFDETWGTGGAPRLISVDYEAVVFYDIGGSFGWVKDDAERIELAKQGRLMAFLMHRTDEGWLVAGFEEEPPQPGWPPPRQGQADASAPEQ